MDMELGASMPAQHKKGCPLPHLAAYLGLLLSVGALVLMLGGQPHTKAPQTDGVPCPDISGTFHCASECIDDGDKWVQNGAEVDFMRGAALEGDMEKHTFTLAKICVGPGGDNSHVTPDDDSACGGFLENENCVELPDMPHKTFLCETAFRSDHPSHTQVLERVVYDDDCNGYTKIVRRIVDGVHNNICTVPCTRAEGSGPLPDTPIRNGGSLGKGGWLTSTFGTWREYPLTNKAASKAGWVPLAGGACDPLKGISFARPFAGHAGGPASTDPVPGSPVVLHYTKGGQIAGVSVHVFGEQWPGVVTAGYWTKMPDGSSPVTPVYMIHLAFRAVKDMCSGAVFAQQLGDRVVVNQGAATGEIEVPLNWGAAVASGWDKYGSCFTGMGVHASYSLNAADRAKGRFAGTSGDDLMPVVAMYDAGTANADGLMTPGGLTSVFIAATIQSKADNSCKDDTKGYDDKGSFFDGKPGEGQGADGMCNNWCAGDGTFTKGLTMTQGAGFCNYDTAGEYDTFHWQFQKPDTIQCAQTKDVVCGASNRLPTLPSAEDTFTFPLGPNKTQMTACDAQCCYPSQANGLTAPHV